MQIEELIPGVNLETRQTEFKGILKEGVKKDGTPEEIGWLKTIVAFANSEGGDLYVGVEDHSHKIVAQDHTEADKTARMVHRQIREKIEPSIPYSIESIAVPGTSPIRYVLKISISASRDLPVTLHSKGMLGIYVRNFGQTESASPEQIRDLVLMSEHIPYDQPFTDQTYQSQDFSVLHQLLNSAGIKVTEKAMISIGFMDNKRRLSKGALLFQDSCRLPETRIVMTQWKGLDKGSNIILAQKEFTGCLLTGIQEGIDFVMDHSTNGFIKRPDTRQNYFAYPQRSVMEGVVNAIGHRNYFIQGSQIEINIFQNRLEITSPGSLLGVRRLNMETDIASIIPRRRNEVICAILEMCRLMEEKGSGFDKIEADYQNADDAHKPYVSCDASAFTLCLPDLTVTSGVETTENQDYADVYTAGLTPGKYDLQILGYCYYKERSVHEIADHIGLKPSTYFRKNTIQRLVKDHYLVESLNSRTAFYRANRTNVLLKHTGEGQ